MHSRWFQKRICQQLISLVYIAIQVFSCNLFIHIHSLHGKLLVPLGGGNVGPEGKKSRLDEEHAAVREVVEIYRAFDPDREITCFRERSINIISTFCEAKHSKADCETPRNQSELRDA